MTRPYKTLMWMVAFVFAAAFALTFIYQPVLFAFAANPWFNCVIFLVLIIGVVHNFQQVTKLYKEISWIENFRNAEGVKKPEVITSLLAPMARMLSKKGNDRLTLSAMSTRSILDSIGNRLDESRDISRYLIGLLIFLGLLGTFWGLLVTINSVNEVIKGMSVEGGEGLLLFENLKAGLQQPLSGMGIAFSSSLFGLAGSLILGFLDLQAGHAQARFFNELEEWLSEITHLSSGALPGDGEAAVPVYVQALLEQTADGLNSLQRELSSQNKERSRLDAHLLTLTHQLAEVGEHLKNNQQPFSEELRDELRILTRTIGASLTNQNKSK